MNSVSRLDYDRWMFPNYQPAEMIPVRGEGSLIWDQKGKHYIDLTAGIAVTSLGHCHPKLNAALKQQSESLWHVSNLYTNEPAIHLAKALVERTFADKVFFCNSGAEANEGALKLARLVAHNIYGEHKLRVISASNSFHGRTLFTVNVGGQPKYTHGFGPKMPGIMHVPYNDHLALEEAMSADVCAVILEPIQGEGGVIPANYDYLLHARKLCDRYQALLIFDEVQTGMGRTGHLFAYEKYEVTPDVLTTAKGLGGGFPIGAVLTKNDWAKHMQVGTHGTTYGGNPLACAVALKVLELIDEQTLNQVNKQSQRLRSGLEHLKTQYPWIDEIRGIGLLLGMACKPKIKESAKRLVALALAEGVMVLQAGPNVIRFAPNLLIKDQDMDEGLKRLHQALARFEPIIED